MPHFEVVSKYSNAGVNLPKRSTAHSAGYDFEVAEDIVVPPFMELSNRIAANVDRSENSTNILTLDEIATITKVEKAKPTLVPTGVKC